MRRGGWVLGWAVAWAGLAGAQQVVPIATAEPPSVSPPVVQTQAIVPLPPPDFNPAGPAGPPPVGATILPVDANPTGAIAQLRSPFQFEAGYLLWWYKDSPPVADGFAGVTSVAGFVNSGGTRLDEITPLVGKAGALDFGARSGLRLGMTTYIDEVQSFGMDASWFQFCQGDETDVFASNGETLLGPTFTDIDGTRSLVLASFPAAVTLGGQVFTQGRSAVVTVAAADRLWGAEMNGRMRLPGGFFFDGVWLLGGVRHLQYGEGVAVTTLSQPLPGSLARSTIELRDSFMALNQFWGPQWGVEARTQFGPLSLDLVGKASWGGMYEQVKVAGETVIRTPAGVQRVPGGVLAQRTNIGSTSSGRMAWVGEVGVKGGWNFTDHCRATVGYNFLGVNSLVRVAGAVDVVDSRGVPVLDSYDPNLVTTRPAPPGLQETYWWAQGLTFGLDVAF